MMTMIRPVAIIAALAVLLPAAAAADPVGGPNTFPIMPKPSSGRRFQPICLQRSRPADERIAACRAAVEAHPGDGLVWRGLGQAYDDKGNPVSAIDACSRAIERNNNFAIEDRARSYLATGDYDHAMDDAASFIMRMHENPASLSLRCRLRVMADKDRDAALADCDAALKKSAHASDALNDRALLLYRMGRMSEALTAADDAVRFGGHAPLALYLRGTIKKQDGDATGEADVVEALSHNPDVAAQITMYRPDRSGPEASDEESRP